MILRFCARREHGVIFFLGGNHKDEPNQGIPGIGWRKLQHDIHRALKQQQNVWRE